MRGPLVRAPRRNEPGPSALSVVTLMIWPPRPPGVCAAQPSAPGKASGPGVACSAAGAGRNRLVRRFRRRCHGRTNDEGRQGERRRKLPAHVHPVCFFRRGRPHPPPRRDYRALPGRLKMTPVSSRYNQAPEKSRCGRGPAMGGGGDKGAERGFATDAIATALRRGAACRATRLPAFPGTDSAGFASGLCHQDAAIGLWPDEIAGWKVGRVAPEFEDQLRPHRLAGPDLLESSCAGGRQRARRFPVFAGGFAAVEAEFVFEICARCAGRQDRLDAGRGRGVGRCHAHRRRDGGQPARDHQRAGTDGRGDRLRQQCRTDPGPAIADWRAHTEAIWSARASSTGESVGAARASTFPGGPVEALRFLLEHCARRGRPLKAGMLVSTGAATGIHDIAAGQRAQVDFGRDGEIACLAVAAKPAMAGLHARGARCEKHVCESGARDDRAKRGTGRTVAAVNAAR